MRMAEPTVQRQPNMSEEEDEILQRKAIAPQISPLIQTKKGATDAVPFHGNAASNYTSLVHTVSRSSGRPLSMSERRYFEPRFGRDFGSVRIHNDSRAHAANQALNARAYSFGNDIAFRSDAYHANTYQGRHLMAHELAHVVQQGHAAPISNRYSGHKTLSISPLRSQRAHRIQRDTGKGGPDFSGAEGEFTWEKKIAKSLTFRVQGEALYQPASGPVKLSKGILKVTRKAGESWGEAMAIRIATLDPLSTNLAEDFFNQLGFDPEIVREFVGFEVKLAEFKFNTSKIELSLLKIELKLPKLDVTKLLEIYSEEFAQTQEQLRAEGHDLKVRAHLGIQWSVPLEKWIVRNPYVAAAVAAGAVSAGISLALTKAYIEAYLEAQGQFLEAAKTGGDVAKGLVQAAEAMVFRQALEVLVMAEPNNMEFDAEVSDHVVGLITEAGNSIQHNVWFQDDISQSVAAAIHPMSNYLSQNDMQEIIAIAENIGLVIEGETTPDSLLAMTPKKFFNWLWDADMLGYIEDPAFLDEIEQKFLRGDWKPSVAR